MCVTDTAEKEKKDPTSGAGGILGANGSNVEQYKERIVGVGLFYP